MPPLLVLGIPAWLAERWLASPRTPEWSSVLRQPAVAWLLGIGAMYLWHLPPLYNAALAHMNVHIVEHLCFIATGVIFWWPVCAPLASARYAPLGALLYLFTAAVAGSALGIILTFASPGLYPAYLNPVDTRGFLRLVRGGWGLSPTIGSAIERLIMWVPGGLVYLCAIIATLARWYGEADTEDEPSPPSRGYAGKSARRRSGRTGGGNLMPDQPTDTNRNAIKVALGAALGGASASSPPSVPSPGGSGQQAAMR